MAGTMSTEERQADLATNKQAIAEVSDADLYSAATADEAPADQGTQEAEPAQAEPKVDASGRVHDPATGKFAPKAKDAEAAPTQQPSTEQAPKTDDEGAQVPSWRLRELREQREAAEKRAQDKERENLELQTHLRSLDARLRQLTDTPKEPPDFYADPAAFVDDRLNPARQELGQQLGQMKEGFSKLIAIDKFGEEAVTAAYSELEKQMREGSGQPDYARIMRSAHPYGELVKWHKSQVARQTVGDDPAAWFEKQLEERLKDPTYQGKVLERIRGTANTQPNGSAPRVQLPPSLNKVAAAARVTGEDDGDLSDASLYRHATR